MKNEKSVIIALDIGTSGVRAVAYTEFLREIATEKIGYTFRKLPNGGAEQDVNQVINSADEVLQQVANKVGSKHILGICLSGTTSSLTAYSKQKRDYEPLWPAWIWADSRSGKEAEILKREIGETAYQKTGCPPHSSYWPAKLKSWKRMGFTDKLDNESVIAGIKEYMFYRLTNQWKMDTTSAATTGMFNTMDFQWDPDLLEWVDIDPAYLPQVVPITHHLEITSSKANSLGLEPTTSVIIGSIDGILAHLGAGCTVPDMMSCMIGTSAALRLGSKDRHTDDQSRTWVYPLTPDFWISGGASNNGGNVLDWFIREYGEQYAINTVPDLLRTAQTAVPEVGGPIFVPFVYGERTPYWNEILKETWENAEGVSAEKIARTVLEGICFNLKGIVEVLDATSTTKIDEIRAMGGFTASDFWVELLATILDRPIKLTSPEPTSAGTAMVGWAAIQDRDPMEYSSLVEVKKVIEPDKDLVNLYQEKYERFNEIRNEQVLNRDRK